MNIYDSRDATLVPARLSDGRVAIEVWFQGFRLATIYGSDGPEIKIVSKHELKPFVTHDGTDYTAEVRVKIGMHGDLDQLLRLEGHHIWEQRNHR